MDHIVGVFYVKDLMRWLAGENGGARGGKPFDLRGLLRPAMFIPESKTIRELLGELLAKRVHMAIVADEYGGTAGLVTFEDIVEEVFGDIQDEYELPEETTSDVRLDTVKRQAEVDARAYIGDVNADLKPLGIELPESEDYDTVGGFVTVTLGRIPTAGESFAHEGTTVTVVAAEPTRVTRVRLEAARSDEQLKDEARAEAKG
jgi:putative hemolysin